MKALLSVRELAEYCGVPVATVYSWNTRGTGPKYYRVGIHVRYRLSEVDAWLERQAQNGADGE
ncbi:helix-turn-helix transcriptional regulator [Amycolatopsis anabasis]|uniref:helix-turn-helix transcriptional regulator n=1 Tax=Amycolatopsis anabasis TaxID=1840409 RepID=UPI00131E4D24|nr:helix-turn-helix domain-containing protein [Amycolatopsis anabasis]